jgi:hypothetical protein
MKIYDSTLNEYLSRIVTHRLNGWIFLMSAASNENCIFKLVSLNEKKYKLTFHTNICVNQILASEMNGDVLTEMKNCGNEI